MNNSELDELFERSKNDRAMIVGSEVRAVIQTVRELEQRLQGYIKATEHYSGTEDHIKQLESRVRELEQEREAQRERATNVQATRDHFIAEAESLQAQLQAVAINSNAKLQNMAIELGEAQGLLKRKSEELQAVTQERDAAVIARDKLYTLWVKECAAFKNFHRSLCTRFDYGHDDVDWRRDQVSLEEHVAAQLQAVTQERDIARAAHFNLIPTELAQLQARNLELEDSLERIEVMSTGADGMVRRFDRITAIAHAALALTDKEKPDGNAKAKG